MELKLFTFGQKMLPGVQAGAPIFAAILTYIDSSWANIFNANKRSTKEALLVALGREIPTSLDDFGRIMANVVKYGERSKSLAIEHVSGAWYTMYLMYRSKLDGQRLLGNLLHHVKMWLEISRFNFLEALRGINM